MEGGVTQSARSNAAAFPRSARPAAASLGAGTCKVAGEAADAAEVEQGEGGEADFKSSISSKNAGSNESSSANGKT